MKFLTKTLSTAPPTAGCHVAAGREVESRGGRWEKTQYSPLKSLHVTDVRLKHNSCRSAYNRIARMLHHLSTPYCDRLWCHPFTQQIPSNAGTKRVWRHQIDHATHSTFVQWQCSQQSILEPTLTLRPRRRCAVNGSKYQRLTDTVP